MLKAISRIDLFGKAVLFNYRGHAKSKSKIGAIFTLILFGFIIWLLIYFGRALFDKSNPKATSFESFNENPDATPITTDNFVFAIGLADPNTYANYINESIYNVYASTYKTVRTPQADGTVQIAYELIPLELEPCTTDHFGKLADQFSYLALDQLYCLKKEQSNLETGHPILQGNFESPIYRSMFISFQECNPNATATCGTQGERDKLLKGGYMSLVYSNIAVDMTDANKPLQMFRDSTYTTVDNAYYKELTLYLDQLEINTDDGWLTTDYKTEDYIRFGEIREFLSLTPKSSFAYFSMRLSNVKTHYNRSYTKIQEVIAQVSGIITVSFTILFLVLAPYVRLKFYETLINEIFDIKTSKDNGKGKPAKKQTVKSQKSKKNAGINKPKSAKKLPSQEDLEQQKSHLKLAKDRTNNTGELTDRKDRDRDFDLSVKRGPSLEESVQGNNISLFIPSQPLAFLKQNSTESQAQERKDNIPRSRFKALSGTPLNMPRLQSETGPINIEIPSQIETPKSSTRNLISPRKPNFMQPNFKVLDYEEHGDDFIETMLKNVDQDNLQYNKVTSEERETEYRNTKMETREGLREGKYKETWPQENMLSNNEEEEQKEPAKKSLDPQRKYRIQKSETIGGKYTGGINLSFCEYLRSWFSKSDVIKEKMYLLNEGITRINERLDIFNLFKKLREFDKLKVLILEDEQFVLFDSLPRPELSAKEKNQDTANRSSLISHSMIKDAQFIQGKRKKELILMSYDRLKRKTAPTMIDKKLFDIYDNRLSMFF